MTIILFLIDTSASMNQRAYLGGRPTLLDVAKGAVETFLKFRQRDPISRGDRYMLLTFEDPPANIKAGWKENHATFMNELKNLQAYSLTTLGTALKNAFDVLNINRMQTGIDTYGQGRCPYYLEPSVIVVITDGGQLSTNVGVQNELNLPLHPNIPGAELTKEPFRWDQRLFSLVLRLSGTPAIERDPNSMVPSDCSPIDAMCEVTGGRSYAVTTQRMLVQCIESLVQKVQSGVVINFEKVGPDPSPIPVEPPAPGAKPADAGQPADPVLNGDEASEKGIELKVDDKQEIQNTKLLSANQNGAVSRPITPTLPPPNNTSWHTCRKLIYVPRSAQKGYSVGHWPIPEAFWPDINSPALPPRTAHPVVKFTCTNNDPMVIDNLPFDKYELEPSPLTQYILSRKQPTVCWQVYVSNSYKNSELGQPFGYLKASTNLACVNLFVMPYNYPVLLPLLDDLFKVHRLKPTREWRQHFEGYLKNMPLYYAGPLKRALQRMGAPNLVPDNMENCLSYSVLNYLKRLKNQAKAEFEKLISSVGTNRHLTPEGIRVMPRSVFRKDINLTSNPALSERFSSLKDQINDFSGFLLGVKDKEMVTQSYRNPFDIPRRNLLDQIARMRANYLQTSLVQTRLQDEDQLHNMPVGQMGNYQEYLKRMPPPLREIESAPVRQHMFGNPFKIDKRMMVDEADIDLVSGGGTNLHSRVKRPAESPSASPRANKRKPGPLPRDVPIRRPQTPLPLLPHSPSPGVNEIKPITPPTGRSNSSNGIDHKPFTIDIPPSNGDMCNHIDGLVPSSPSENELVNHVGEDRQMNDESKLFENSDLGVPRQNATLNNCLDLNRITEENAKIKTLLFKELRKPGRNFSQLFSHLANIQGPAEVRIAMVRTVINEALRFKRKALVQLLENYEKTLIQIEPLENHKIPTSPTR